MKALGPTGVCHWCGEECSTTFCRPECYRAEANRGDGDMPRIIRDHEEVAKHDPDPEVQRIARGLAMISRARLAADEYRTLCYDRLARGEDITRESGRCPRRVR